MANKLNDAQYRAIENQFDAVTNMELFEMMVQNHLDTLEKVVYQQSQEDGFPKEVDIAHLEYDFDIKPNISKEQATNEFIDGYDFDGDNFEVKDIEILNFYKEHVEYLDIKAIIYTEVSEYNNVNHEQIDDYAENYQVDLNQLDDNEVLNEIDSILPLYEKHLAKISVLETIGNQIEDELPYVLNNEDYSRVMKDFNIFFTKELVKPSDLGQVNEIAKEMIIKYLLDTEEKIKRILYDENVLLDGIIANQLYSVNEPKSNEFAIRYDCEPSEVKVLLKEYVNELVDTSQFNVSVEEISKEMEDFYSSQSLFNHLLRENPDGLINNIVIGYATEQGIDYEIAKQLDIHKDVTFHDVNIDLKVDFDNLAETEKEAVETNGIDRYLEVEFYDHLYYGDLFDISIGSVDFNEDAIQEIKNEM